MNGKWDLFLFTFCSGSFILSLERIVSQESKDMQDETLEDLVIESIKLWNPFWNIEEVLTTEYANYLFVLYQKNRLDPRVLETLNIVKENKVLSLTSPNNFIRRLAEVLS
jgi:hypothetical protein